MKGTDTERQEINEIRLVIAPTQCLEEVCSQWSKEEKPGVLPEVRRQSRESREPKAAVVPRTEDQRQETCKKESSGGLQLVFQCIQLNSGHFVSVRKLPVPGERSI